MALIGKIRRNMWLLVVPLALGLAGFIMMDMFSGQGSMLGNSQAVVGNINGSKISWNRFNNVDRVVSKFLNNGADAFARRSTLWNYFVEESLLKDEAEALGLGVGKEELMDLHFGANPSPIISQRFIDPTTGQLDRVQLNSYKQSLESNQFTNPEFRAFWGHQEHEIIKTRLQGKLNALVEKAIYTPRWMAEMGNAEFNQSIDFEYVRVPFDEIDNADVPLADGDYQAYIDENVARFKRKNGSRKVKYTIFDVLPSPKDSADLLNKMNQLIGKFSSTENDTLFIEKQQGVFPGIYLNKEQLNSPSLSDTIDQMEIGQVFGPFIQNGNFNAAKLVDRISIADSADTRHILIGIDPQNPASEVVVKRRIDSLANLLETGAASWDSLALKFSEDPGSRLNGGKYENVPYGQFVPAFNQKLFIDGEIGKLYKIRTEFRPGQFGWHIIEVLRRTRAEQTRYRVGQIFQPIIPSDSTTNALYDDVQIFLSENKSLSAFIESVSANPELSLETSNQLDENAFSIGTLGGGQSSREIIQWAFKAKADQVSPEIYSYQDPINFNVSKYVVVALDEVIPAGPPTVDQVKSNIELEVLNLKKGNKIKADISGKEMAAIASEYQTTVDTAQRVNFDQDNILNLGPEPKVIAKAYSLNIGETSEPIIGSSGVYVIKIINKPDAPSDPNIPQIRQRDYFFVQEPIVWKTY